MYYLDVPQSANPSYNLAVEEFAVRNLDLGNDYLFIYQNSPAVVIGKHQNPYLECHIYYCQKNNIPVRRRISGGGAVFHGPGNVNFSFFTRNTQNVYNNYRLFLEPMVELLNKMGAPVEINKRNDLVINGLKVSGNAQFTSRDRLLCHGTLLYDADLENLGQSLKGITGMTVETHCTPSVRSSVTNIKPYLVNKNFDIKAFSAELKKAVLNKFGNMGLHTLTEAELLAVKEAAVNKFESWDWNWGQTPKFKVQLQDSFPGSINLEILNGRLKTRGKYSDQIEPDIAELIQKLDGIPYDSEVIDTQLQQYFVTEPLRKQLTDFLFPFGKER